MQGTAPGKGARAVRALACLLALGSASVSHGLDANLPPANTNFSLTDTLGSANYQQQGSKLKDLANFDSCLQYKVGLGMHWCKGFFGIRFPSPCVKFTYNEPAAVVEVTPDHNGQHLDTGFNPFNSIMAGSVSPEEKKGRRGIQTGSGTYASQYDEAKVYKVTPVARYLSSGTATQATQSFTCGIFGKLGTFMNFTQAFNIKNITQGLNPANLGQRISSGIKNVTTNLSKSLENLGSGLTESVSNIGSNITQSVNGIGANLSNIAGSLNPADLAKGAQTLAAKAQTTITNQLQSLQNMGSGLAGQLDGLASGTLRLQDLNLQDLGRAAGVMSMLGPVIGELGSIGSDANAVNTGVGLTAAAEAAKTLEAGAKSGTLSEPEARALAASIGSAMQLGMSEFVAPTDPILLQGADNPPANARGPNGEPNSAFIPHPPQNPYLNWNTSMIATTGSTEVGDGLAIMSVRQLDEMWEKTTGWLDEVIKNGDMTTADLDNTTPAELCTAQYYLKDIKTQVDNLYTRMTDRDNPAKVIPAATYLGAVHRQVSPEDQPNAACPLTHAGFVSNGVDDKAMVLNCHEYCWDVRRIAGDTEEKVCRIVPKPGFAGSCFTNPLSKERFDASGKFKEDTWVVRGDSAPAGDKFPACNGHIPAEVADGRLGTQIQGERYDASKDHFKQINARLRNQYAQDIAARKPGLISLQAKVDGYIKTQGGTCDELGSPTGPWAEASNTRRPGSSQVAGVMERMSDAQSAINQSAFLGGVPLQPTFLRGTALPSAGSMLTMMDGMMRGGVQNMVAGRVNAIVPTGVLPMVYNSSNGGAVPHPSASGMIGKLGNNIMAAGSGMAYSALCAGKSALTDIGIAPTAATSSIFNLSSKVCIGSLGLRHPETGHTFGQNTQKNQKLVAFRFLGIAEDMKAVPKCSPKDPNCADGLALFNKDYPQNYTNDDYSKALTPVGTVRSGRHNGSGCYKTGTMDPRVDSRGEKLLPLAENLGDGIKGLNPLTASASYGKGHQILTSWTGTQCCVPIFCPTNVRRDYP